MVKHYCVKNNLTEKVLEIGPGVVPFSYATDFIGCNEKIKDYIDIDIDKEFIPYPATWLNQMRYLDELDFEESKPKKPPIPWYSTDELTLAKAKELGITPYAGESYAQLRQRISTQISRQATV